LICIVVYVVGKCLYWFYVMYMGDDVSVVKCFCYYFVGCVYIE